MIIPALDIIHGKAVRLYQGNYHMKSDYGHPMSILKQYITQGALMVHLVDLNGAQNPINRQLSLIKKIITETSNKLKIQVGGGIRNITDIEMLLKLGAHRIILGSIAITQSKTVKNWFKYFDPNTLVLAIDIHIYSEQNRKVVIHGWQKEMDIQFNQVIEDYNSVGLKHVLCTDTRRDGTLLGSNTHLYKSICSSWPHISFQASGGIFELKEISKLRHIGAKSIIIGRAFLEKKFTVQEAIECWQNA